MKTKHTVPARTLLMALGWGTLIWVLIFWTASSVMAQETDLSSKVNDNAVKVSSVRGELDGLTQAIEALTIATGDLGSRLATSEQALLEMTTRVLVLESSNGGGETGPSEPMMLPDSCTLLPQNPLLGASTRFVQARDLSWYSWDKFDRFYTENLSVRANGLGTTVILASGFLSPADMRQCLNDLLTIL